MARRTSRFVAPLLPKYYPGWPNDFEHFAVRARQSIKTAGRILDLGAGAGIIDALDWRAEGRRIVGIDLDPRVGRHPHLDGAALADARKLPFPDNSFDSAVSVNVLEHIPQPVEVLREVHRVLKPGGVFLVKTPNRDHYVGRMARLTPNWFHEWYNSLRGRNPEDTFPTNYQFNRFKDVRRVSLEAGFEKVEVDAFEGIPEYLLLSVFLFFPGLLYERWVNAKPERNRFRASIEAVLRKAPETT